MEKDIVVCSGELDLMCSPEEISMRTETRQVDKFEFRPDSTVDPEKCLKKYQRSSADKRYLPSEIRTVGACLRSVEYLLSKVLDFDVFPKPGFGESCYSADFFDVYSFLRDRLRAVRVDLHVSNCVGDPKFVLLHEICLRFELLSLFLLWGRDFGADDRKFDLHMSLTALSQTIDPLTNAYQQTDIVHANQPEITAYILLLSLTSRGGSMQFKSHFVKQPKRVKEHPQVLFAFRICVAFYAGNWAEVLAGFRSANFLSACAMLPIINRVRASVLWRMVRTNRPFFVRDGPMPVPRPERLNRLELQSGLVFEQDFDLCFEFLKFHGLDVHSDVCCLPPRQLSRNPIRWWLSSNEWIQRGGRPGVSNYVWNDLFAAKLGEEVGDICPPESSLFPKRVEPSLTRKYTQTRREIVTGTSTRKLVAHPTFSAQGSFAFEPHPTQSNVFVAQKSVPVQNSLPIIHQNTAAQPLVLPTSAGVSLFPTSGVSLFPTSGVVQPPLFVTASPTAPNATTQHMALAVPVEIPETPVVNKRDRDSPPVAAKPIKRYVLPSQSSDFDLLAAQLAQVCIQPLSVSEPLTKPPTEVTRELEMTKLRTKFIALKCLREWRAVREDRNKWFVKHPTRIS